MKNNGTSSHFKKGLVMPLARPTLTALVACAAIALLPTTASAAQLTVNNYNFSSQYIGSGVQFTNVGSAGYTGWTTVGFDQSFQYLENGTNGGFTNPPSSSGSITPPASAYQPGLSGPYYQYAAEDGKGTIYQDLGVAFAPFTTYTVDISGGHRDGWDNNWTTFGLVSSLTSISGDGPATTLATEGFVDEGSLAVGVFDWASNVGSNGAVFSYTTGASAPSGNVVVYVQNTTTNRMHLGGVTVSAFTTSVPEIDPAGMGSVVALVSGALGLFERRRLKAA